MKDTSSSLRGQTLVDRVVQRIGQDIVSQRFRPGVALPNETEWCEQLGISRSVLREGLRVLVSKNLITIRSRLGGRVRERSEWNLLDPDILSWHGHGEDQDVFAAELFELRRTIEPAAAGLAAARIADEQLVELRNAYEAMARAGEDTVLFFEPDGRFHRTILGAVGNSLFLALAQTVMVALEITLRMALDAPKGQQQSLPLHEAVLVALERRAPEEASAAMLRLVDASERDVAEARAARAGKVKLEVARLRRAAGGRVR
ncbi:MULTISPECIES: FadR/GntR family transcriptional regulator [unclassified Acidisoma]|jgi:GntR family galactonate operon transcriptional repressor|uniref:FadR/GntR family transcriptional regulator n=1 Tax=unclassified Acidisoma TaxID=2634065 RepID=UPI00131E3556|nr:MULTISPECIES: FadR/GntR family transcriptional regulator [unclassified Acidisoma]